MPPVPPPIRPAQPARPPVPQAVVAPKPTVPAVQAPAPVVATPTQPASVPATVDTSNMGAPAQAVVAPAATVPETKTRKTRTPKPTEEWYGVYVYADVTDPATGLTTSQVQYDTDPKDSTKQIPRKQRLAAVPALTTNGGIDGGFDPDKNTALTKRDFVKLGDFFRFGASIAQYRATALLAKAAEADAGKIKTRAPKGSPKGRVGKTAQKLAAQMQSLLETLKKQLDPVAYAAVEAQYKASIDAALGNTPAAADAPAA